MATLISKGPRVQQQPDNLLVLLQSRVNFDVEEVLFSNTLITGQSLVDPRVRNWTILLQTYWQLLLEPEENPVGGGSHHPQFPEDPSGGGERWPSFPEDGGSGGERWPASMLPEEPAGRGGRILAFPIERPGTEDEVDEDGATFPQEPIEDDIRPAHMALVWTFDGSGGVQRLVEVPSFPPEDIASGTESPTYYCFGGDGYHCPESPGGAGGD